MTTSESLRRQQGPAVTAKPISSADIAQHTAEFIARGGHVQKVETGRSGLKIHVRRRRRKEVQSELREMNWRYRTQRDG